MNNKPTKLSLIVLTSILIIIFSFFISNNNIEHTAIAKDNNPEYFLEEKEKVGNYSNLETK